MVNNYEQLSGEMYYSEEKNLGMRLRRIILSIQHLVAMFGATVLVPIITGFDPSVALFSAGMGTLIFHLCTKGKVPAFLGSSFAFIPVILQVSKIYDGDLAYVQGGLLVAGIIYIFMSFLVKQVGVEKIEKVLSPQVVGPMIMVIGLKLIPTALDMASQSYLIAGITLSIALFVNFRTKGFIKQLSILTAVIGGYIISLRMGIVDTDLITNASVFGIPAFRLPKFSLDAIFIISPVVLAVFMEHLGDITTNSYVVGKNFLEDPGLNRTLLGDGLATVFASMVGGPANTTYGENTGVLAITKNYDPSILRMAAVFAIGLAFFSKLGGVVNSIPPAVMGGISLMLFSMIALVGLKTIRNNKVEVNSKNMLVMATILVLGLFGDYVSEKYGILIGIPITKAVSITGISFAALVGIVLNLILNKNR